MGKQTAQALFIMGISFIGVSITFFVAINKVLGFSFFAIGITYMIIGIAYSRKFPNKRVNNHNNKIKR